MAFDYKKEYKEFYLPPQKPGLIMVPEMQYVAVRGRAIQTSRGETIRKLWGLCTALHLRLK